MNVFILTVATRSMPELGYLLASAQMHGLHPVVMGMGDPRMRPGHIEFQIKFEYVKDWLRTHLGDGSVKPHDLVVVVDGYDVIVRGNKQDILDAWKKVGEPSVLLSGERYCWPDGHKWEFFDNYAAKFPQSPYKYICAGSFAGTAAALLDTLTNVKELNTPGETDDQRMWTDAFMACGKERAMAIDRYHDMLPSVGGDSVEECMAKGAPFLHCNGVKGKEVLDACFRQLYPDVLQPGDISATTTTTSLAEVGASGKCTQTTPKWVLPVVIVLSILAALGLVTTVLLARVIRQRQFKK